MAKSIERLKDTEVKNAKGGQGPAGPGVYRLNDGGGLYLRVLPTGSKSWVWVYRHQGKLREMGLGTYDPKAVNAHVSLAKARRLAHQHRDARHKGKGAVPDPVAERRRDRQAKLDTAAAERAKRDAIPTFETVARDLIAMLEKGKKPLSGSSLIEWNKTLANHVFPKFGARPIDQVTQDDVADALREIWEANRSAPRVLNRVERVFNRAVALKHRTDNPATWAIQQHLLGSAADKGEHHAALPWAEVPALMSKLREQDATLAQALEFLILTGARLGEVVGDVKPGREKAPLPWSEIDIEARLWTVSADRMKKRVRHVVPLSDRAMAILTSQLRLRGNGEYVFDYGKRGRNDKMFDPLLKGIDATVHGFRSSFSDWANENGYGADPRLIELALAHKLRDASEAAYNRTNRVAERAPMMERWANFCATGQRGNVVELRRA
jgi:integrase